MVKNQSVRSNAKKLDKSGRFLSNSFILVDKAKNQPFWREKEKR